MKIVPAYLSNLAENVLVLNGKPFSFEMFPPKRVIYDDPALDIVEVTSRQVGKSTDLAAFMTLRCSSQANFNCMYVAPQSKHKSDFSHQKLTPLIDGSPFIKSHTSYRLVNNVDFKQFTNHSTMLLKYAYLTDLPLRGPSTDMNLWDEFQDANPSIFLVGQETLNRSAYKYTVITGTPKSTLTPLHKHWISSTMLDVMYKCQGCGHWNLPSVKHVKREGVCCEKCGKLLTPDKWEWVCMGDPDSRISGYHYNKLGLAIFRDPLTDWYKDVWAKLEGPENLRFSLAKFKNEVLGEPDDESLRPISVQDLIECCSGKGAAGRPILSLEDIDQRRYAGRDDYWELSHGYVYCAIDWGTTNTTSSNTVLVLGARDRINPDMIKVFLIKRFFGEESSYEFILNYIYRLYNLLPNIVFFAADNGMGMAQNSIIRSRLGPDKLFGFQFTFSQREKFKWHVVEGSAQEQFNAYYTVSKVTAYDQFFYEVKENLWEFPQWFDFKPIHYEILNVEQEFNEDKNKYIYTHAEENPDDVPSALIYLRSIIELSAGLV